MRGVPGMGERWIWLWQGLELGEVLPTWTWAWRGRMLVGVDKFGWSFDGRVLLRWEYLFCWRMDDLLEASMIWEKISIIMIRATYQLLSYTPQNQLRPYFTLNFQKTSYNFRFFHDLSEFRLFSLEPPIIFKSLKFAIFSAEAISLFQVNRQSMFWWMWRFGLFL